MTITWRSVSPAMLATTLHKPVTTGVYWQADTNTFLLELPHIARFQVQGGVIQYACLGDLEETAVRILGAGLPAAAAWVQQGYLALHAATVTTPTGSVVFAGPSAVGKSVLATTLAQRGYSVLVDEVTPLRLLDVGPLTTHAMSSCDVLLWQDSVEGLGLDTDVFKPLRPGLPRYVLHGFGTPGPLPPVSTVRAIYLLGIHNNSDIQQSLLDGGKRILAVIAASFNRYLPQPDDLRQRTFLQLAVKLADVPVYRLLRPHMGWSASALADLVLEDLTS